MAARQRMMPLLCLLVRLGWQRDPELWTVRCRDDSQPRNYWVGQCGHRVPQDGPVFRVFGPCRECDADAT